MSGAGPSADRRPAARPADRRRTQAAAPPDAPHDAPPAAEPAARDGARDGARDRPRAAARESANDGATDEAKDASRGGGQDRARSGARRAELDAAPPWPDAPARFLRVARALARAPGAAGAIGATPAETVATRDGSRLVRHVATAAPRPDAAPLIVVHGLVGAGEIVDLAPHCSLVGDLVARGFAVYSVVWRDGGGLGAGGDALWRALAFEDFALDRLGFFAEAATGLEGRRPALLGVCEGGVFAACLAALEPRLLAGAALAVTPIDFHAEPDAALARLIRSLGRETLAGMIEVMGGVPGPVMDAAFRRLTPARTLAKYTHDLMATNGADAAVAQFLRMEAWLAARPDHPAAAARQALIELYHDNALVRGAFRLDGRRVALGAITAPVLALYGLRDHLVPPACATAIGRLTGGTFRAAPIDAGHVGVFVSRRARGLAADALAAFLTDQAVRAASLV